MQVVPALGARVGRSSRRWRSLQKKWGGEGKAVATTAMSCGGDDASGTVRESEGEEGRPRERERGAGRCVASRGASRRRGGGQAGRCHGSTAVRKHRPHAPGLLAGGQG